MLGQSADTYQNRLDDLIIKIDEYFWCEEKGAYIDTFESGKKNVTRHANIFALLFGYGTEAQRKSIVKNVILNDEVPKISTPYFKFYELEAMCTIGKLDYVFEQIKGYWGAMIEIGATTFWEEFDIDWIENAGRIDEIVPDDKIDIHTSYGRGCYKKLRLSLCHGWASGPAPFMVRNILGVHILEPGCKKVAITPNLAGLDWACGTYPTPYGIIKIEHRVENGEIISKVTAPEEVEIIK